MPQSCGSPLSFVVRDSNKLAMLYWCRSWQMQAARQECCLRDAMAIDADDWNLLASPASISTSLLLHCEGDGEEGRPFLISWFPHYWEKQLQYGGLLSFVLRPDIPPDPPVIYGQEEGANISAYPSPGRQRYPSLCVTVSSASCKLTPLILMSSHPHQPLIRYPTCQGPNFLSYRVEKLKAQLPVYTKFNTGP